MPKQGARLQTQAYLAVAHASACRHECALGFVGLLAFLSLLVGCEPNLVVGKWSCEGAGGEANVSLKDAVTLPWSTGFENGFCDYGAVGDFCYAVAPAAYTTVTSPVHSGDTAAAFSLVADGGFGDLQARCVRQGELPVAAYYSAYFLVPAAPTAVTNWNLMHFRSGDGVVPADGLWDLSLARQPDGSYQLFVYDFLRRATRTTTNLPAIPIGEWFQLTAYLQRSPAETGEFAVYQDGELGLRLTDLSTDDAEYGEWYVGNLAAALAPESTVIYVDDVTIRDAL